ncbi:hypothetical protein T06_8653, partial [Trichinella sp. T6]
LKLHHYYLFNHLYIITIFLKQKLQECHTLINWRKEKFPLFHHLHQDR